MPRTSQGSVIAVIFIVTTANAQDLTSSASRPPSRTPTTEQEAIEHYQRGQFDLACPYLTKVAYSVRGHSLAASCYHYWALKEPSKWDNVVTHWSKAADACKRDSPCMAPLIMHRDSAKGIAESTSRIKDLENDSADKDATIGALNKDIEDLNGKADRLEEQQSVLCAQLGLEANSKDCAAKLDERLKEAGSLRAKVKSLQQQIIGLRAERDQWKTRALKAEKEVKELKERLYKALAGMPIS
jgi:peptidoglycan hydrolase CwlO-like protein